MMGCLLPWSSYLARPLSEEKRYAILAAAAEAVAEWGVSAPTAKIARAEPVTPKERYFRISRRRMRSSISCLSGLNTKLALRRSASRLRAAFCRARSLPAAIFEPRASDAPRHVPHSPVPLAAVSTGVMRDVCGSKPQIFTLQVFQQSAKPEGKILRGFRNRCFRPPEL